MEIMKFGVSGGGGDFADGGEAGGANRSLGNTDNFDLSFLTNNVARMTIKGSGRVEMTESLQLVSTTTSALGVIYKESNSFLHDFHHPTGGGAIPQGRNVFLGRSAGNFTMGSTATLVQDSSNNVAIGYLALRDNTIGANNIAAGSLTLYHNTTGNYSVAIGYQALRDSTIGHRNMAIGGDALRYNISGTCNVGIGISALRENQTLSYNVCIGYGSGRGVSGLSNIQGCTFLGSSAGSAIRTGGNNNICIGYHAGDNITTGATNLVIGSNLGALSATGSNQLNIASTIFGNTSTHRVGVNTSTLDEILNLSGAIKLGTSIADTTGAIRWTGTDFEGRTSTAWKSLTKDAGDVLTTRGDILYRDAAGLQRLPLGAYGAFLTCGNGTDPFWYEPATATGDLLTQAAAGYLVPIAAGTNNHVLTSNGAGTLPTWQAAAGGTTEEFFTPVTDKGGTATYTEFGYRMVAMCTANDHYGLMTFQVPDNYSSLVYARVVIIPRNTDTTFIISKWSSYGAPGQAYNTHTQQVISESHNCVNYQIYEVNVANILTSLAANDHVGLKLLQAGDLNDMNIVGLRFKYNKT